MIYRLAVLVVALPLVVACSSPAPAPPPPTAASDPAPAPMVSSAPQTRDSTVVEPPAGPRRPSRAVDPALIGTLKGVTSWPELKSSEFKVPVRIVLTGDGAQTEGHRATNRVMLGDPYVVTGIPEGPYHLEAWSAGTKLWDTRVEIAAGRDTVFDLTPEKSSVSPKDFRPFLSSGTGDRS